jgi:hypothetical protein
LGDLVVFNHIFIDKIAADQSHIGPEKVAAAFGSLGRIFCFVQPSADVYRYAIEKTVHVIKNLPDDMQGRYLEDHLRSSNDLTEFWDGTLKHLFDTLTKLPVEKFPIIPSSFVDTNGSVERLLVYLEIQRQSGAPVRLTPSRMQLLAKLDRLLPDSMRQLSRGADPHAEVEMIAMKRLFDENDVEAPAISNLLMRELGNAKGSTSLIEIIEEVRSWSESVKYRDWLWRYYQTYAKRKPLERQKLRDQLSSHLEGMRQAGNGRSWRTARIRFSASAFGISIPITLRVPRWVTDDFVGFIGEWFEPDPRPKD